MIKRWTLYFSCGLHLILFVLIFRAVDEQSLPKKFLVLGVHSKLVSQAYYNPLKDPVPFVRHKPVQRKKSLVAAVKKPEPKKKIVAPVAPQQKNTAKKLTPKKSAPVKKTSTPAQPRVVKKTVTKPQPESTPHQEKIAITKPEEVDASNEQLALTLGGASDPEMFAYQKAVQEAIEKQWSPPLGVPKGTECVVSFSIDAKGVVEKFEIVERSIMLLYDLSITRVAKKFVFDKCLWGKRFTITFRQ